MVTSGIRTAGPPTLYVTNAAAGSSTNSGSPMRSGTDSLTGALPAPACSSHVTVSGRCVGATTVLALVNATLRRMSPAAPTLAAPNATVSRPIARFSVPTTASLCRTSPSLVTLTAAPGAGRRSSSSVASAPSTSTVRYPPSNSSVSGSSTLAFGNMMHSGCVEYRRCAGAVGGGTRNTTAAVFSFSSVGRSADVTCTHTSCVADSPPAVVIVISTRRTPSAGAASPFQKCIVCSSAATRSAVALSDSRITTRLSPSPRGPPSACAVFGASHPVLVTVPMSAPAIVTRPSACRPKLLSLAGATSSSTSPATWRRLALCTISSVRLIICLWSGAAGLISVTITLRKSLSGWHPAKKHGACCPVCEIATGGGTKWAWTGICMLALTDPPPSTDDGSAKRPSTVSVSGIESSSGWRALLESTAMHSRSVAASWRLCAASSVMDMLVPSLVTCPT